MNRRSLNILFAAIFTTGLIMACGERQRKSNRTDTASSGTISFASDESFSPIVDECREVFEYSRPQAHLTPMYMSEGEGMDLLMKDSIQLVVAARNFRPGEIQELQARKFLPAAIPIAYDGLALIVNRNNPDSCITVADVKVVFDRNRSSAVQFCVDSLLDGRQFGDNTVAAKSSAEVIDYVEKTPNAIGIIGSNWLNDKRDTTNTTFKKNITVMRVSKKDSATVKNSWQPYQYYLLDGRYPLVRTIYALLNDPYHALPWAFAHFMESPKGQLIILKSGLLPMRGDITIRDVRVKQE